MTVFALAAATDVEQVTELAQARARPLSFEYGTFRRLAEALTHEATPRCPRPGSDQRSVIAAWFGETRDTGGVHRVVIVGPTSAPWAEIPESVEDDLGHLRRPGLEVVDVTTGAEASVCPILGQDRGIRAALGHPRGLPTIRRSVAALTSAMSRIMGWSAARVGAALCGFGGRRPSRDMCGRRISSARAL